MKEMEEDGDHLEKLIQVSQMVVEEVGEQLRRTMLLQKEKQVDGDLQKQTKDLRMKEIAQTLPKVGETAKEDLVLQVGEQIKIMMLVLLEDLEVDGVTTITKEVAIILRKDLEEDHLITITIIMEDIKSLKKEIDKEEVGDSIIIIIARMEVVGVVVKGILIAHGKITILAVKLVEVDGKIITIMDLISGKEIAKKMILAEDGD